MAHFVLPSFSDVFAEQGRFVWRALRYLGVREADLDDVCQEVFLVVHRKLDEFEGRSSLRTWLYAIAVRVAADYRKSAYVRRVQPMESQVEGPIAFGPRHSGCLERAEARQLLDVLLESLDDDKRQVVVLHQLEGFSVPEVAEILGCPVQTAYTRLNAAKQRLEQVARRLEDQQRRVS